MKLKLLIISAALFFSVNAHATLAGKNVILVHGHIFDHLETRPSFDERIAVGDEYWLEFWASRAEATMVYPSFGRVRGLIKDDVRRQFLEYQESGLCADGCIFITHSTGDLVLRDALTRLNQWGIDQTRFKILSVIDIAGAGGGTGLADLAVNVARDGGVVSGVVQAIAGGVIGTDFEPENLGVLNDLRVANARSIAQQNNVFPRLRVTGAGDDFLRITKGFIQGFDDSVVGLHSACGARFAGNVESCSNSVRSDGRVAGANGPDSLLHNHFPIIMGDSADHSELISNERSGGTLTTVENNSNIGGLEVDFETTTRRRWFRTFREIDNSANQSVSATVFQTLNN